MPSWSRARCRRGGRRRRQVRRGAVGQPEVRVPAERDGHAPATGRDDRRVDAEHRIPDDRGDLDPVRGTGTPARRRRWRRGLGRCRHASRAGRPTTRARRRGIRGWGGRGRRRADRCLRGRRRRRRRGSGGGPGGSPRARATATRRSVPIAARRALRGARGARPRGSAARRRSCRCPGRRSPRAHRTRARRPAPRGTGVPARRRSWSWLGVPVDLRRVRPVDVGRRALARDVVPRPRAERARPGRGTR